MQGTDHAEVRQAMQRGQAVLRKMLLDKDDRTPRATRPFSILFVDPVHQFLDFLFQRFVLGNTTAAWHTHLHKYETFLILRVRGKETIQSAKALADAFCIIQAVDSDADYIRVEPQCATPALHFLLRGFRLSHGVVLFEVNADGKRPNRRGLAGAYDVLPFAIHFRLHAAVYRVQKVLAVEAQMKSEQIVAQHTVQQFFLPWETAQNFRIGPGYMPELGNDQVRIAFFQHPRQQCEMKILNEHESGRIACFFQYCACKNLIDLSIRLPVFRSKGRPRENNVTKRPQRLVCEAVVVALFLAPVEPDAP